MKHIPYAQINNLGNFIVFEGINGSGKSTQTKLLQQKLLNEGIENQINHEPTNGLIGRLIREIIENKKINIKDLELDEFLEKLQLENSISKNVKLIISQFNKKNQIKNEEAKRQFLFIVDRYYDIKNNIEPALNKNKWLVEDRYDISCYLHGIANGLDFNYLTRKHKEILKNNYLGPNLIIFYWIKTNTALKRLKNSNKIIDIYENAKMLKKIEKAARWLFAFRFETPKIHQPLIRKLKIEGKNLKVAIINAEPSIDEVFEETWKVVEKIKLNHMSS